MFQRNLPPSWRIYQRTLQGSRRRQRLESVAGLCVIVVLAGLAAALTYAVLCAVFPVVP